MLRPQLRLVGIKTNMLYVFEEIYMLLYMYTNNTHMHTNVLHRLVSHYDSMIRHDNMSVVLFESIRDKLMAYKTQFVDI